VLKRPEPAAAAQPLGGAGQRVDGLGFEFLEQRRQRDERLSGGQRVGERVMRRLAGLSEQFRQPRERQSR
jgi:hypothetical protein